MLLLPLLEINISFVFGLNAIPCGCVPTDTVPTTDLVKLLITVILLEVSLATIILLETGS